MHSSAWNMLDSIYALLQHFLSSQAYKIFTKSHKNAKKNSKLTKNGKEKRWRHFAFCMRLPLPRSSHFSRSISSAHWVIAVFSPNFSNFHYFFHFQFFSFKIWPALLKLKISIHFGNSINSSPSSQFGIQFFSLFFFSSRWANFL